jgi:hypothetical protein
VSDLVLFLDLLLGGVGVGVRLEEFQGYLCVASGLWDWKLPAIWDLCFESCGCCDCEEVGCCVESLLINGVGGLITAASGNLLWRLHRSLESAGWC